MAGVSRIVAGVDGSDSSKAALLWAYDEASHHGATLTVVSTWEPPALPMSPPYGGLTDKDYQDQPRNMALEILDRLVNELEDKDPAVDVHTSIEEGHAAQVLIERSKEADLLVVGSRGHGGFAGMLLGSVGHHLVTHAHCPVVVVR